MNYNENLLIEILSAAIHDIDPQRIMDSGINWEIIFDEAQAQQIAPILFPVIKRLDCNCRPNEELILKWKKETMLTGINQIQHIKQISKAILAFNSAGIQSIALKGLTLRNLYPCPELRTMVDADILIHLSDLPLAKTVLSGMGYFEEGSNSVHLNFHHPNALPIELHWSLINEELYIHGASFEYNIWSNIERNYICGIPVFILSPEYQLIHLLLHMAVHMLVAGFGLRQLCDLVLLIENNENNINWDIFKEQISQCKLQQFTRIVLLICKKHFNLKLPAALNEFDEIDTKPIDLLMQNIISGGVYGKRNVSKTYGTSVLYYPTNKNYKNLRTRMLYFISIFFPSGKKLGEKFSYAKHYPILQPIAWIHRLIFIILRKDFTLSEKSEILSSLKLYTSKREKLLQWLGLLEY